MATKPPFREWLATLDRRYTEQVGGLLLANFPFYRLNAMYENNYTIGQALEVCQREGADH